MEEELQKLRAENHDLKEQLKSSIPRRRVRRVYKQLKSILELDINDENKECIELLTKFVQKIEKDGPQEAGQDIKKAIERALGLIDLDNINDIETTTSFYVDEEQLYTVLEDMEGDIQMDLFTKTTGKMKFHRKY